MSTWNIRNFVAFSIANLIRHNRKIINLINANSLSVSEHKKENLQNLHELLISVNCQLHSFLKIIELKETEV